MIYGFDFLSLRAPAGNGQANDPGDIGALDNALRRIDAYSPPPEYAAEPQPYATEPMIRALEKLQEQNGLKIDGYANPNGPTERAINNRLLRKPRGAALFYDPPPALADAIGNGFANRSGDVSSVQRKLGALGYVPEDPFDRPHGFIDARTIEGLARFQRDRGLTADGSAAPRGETERALDDALSDLARTTGHEWLRFAERAMGMRTGLSNKLDGPNLAPDRYTNALDHRLDRSPNAESEGEVIQVQSRGTLGRVPTLVPPWIGIDPETQEITPGSPADVLRRFVESAGRYGGNTAGSSDELRRQDLPEREKAGTSTILVPPYVPNEPNRGPDPSNPPLDPRYASPAPFPNQPTHVSNKAENIPPRIDPREYIIPLPDLSDWISRFPVIVENRHGDPPVQDLNRNLGRPVTGIGNKVFGEGSTKQIGGPRPDPAARKEEHFERFPYKQEFGIKSNYGGSFEDVTFLISYNGMIVKLVINTVSLGKDGLPVSRENRQRAKVVLNSENNTFIIDVDKPKPTERVDFDAWKGFLESRMGYIKYLIDNKIIEPRSEDNPNPDVTKILDFFRYYRGR